METKTVDWRQQNADGSLSVFYSDGSWAKIDMATGAIIAQDDSPNPARAAAMRSGGTARRDAVQKAASQEDARRFTDVYNQKADEIKKNYDINMMQARTGQDQQRARAQYERDQTQLQRDTLAFNREESLRNFGLSERELGLKEQGLGLQQAQLAHGLIQTGAEMHRDPSDWFMEQEWQRGVAGRPETSTFLSALQNNTRMADFGARGAPAEVNSMGGLVGKLMGGGGQDNSGNYLAQIGNIATKGPHQVGAGTLEQLTPTEMKLFTGGLRHLGYDADAFLAGHRRSRINQGFGMSRSA